MGKAEGKAASAVSLGLSLSLAVLLVVMTATADPQPPEQTEPPRDEASNPEETRREPGLAAVYLPPPPEISPAPVAEPAVAPPEPPAPAAPEPPPEPPVARTPVPEVVVAAAPPPVPQAPEPSPPQAKPEPPPELVAITPDSIREGRALLRLLERGEGPDIEIAWPAAAADRAELYRLFSDCFGMRTVIMSAGGEMYGAGAFNGDRYSGFVRQPTGGLSAGERTRVYAIRDRHGVEEGRVLRLFPRRVDAILLGGLQSIAGDRFDKGVRIRARYRAVANGIEVAGLQIDGRAATEIIVLPYTVQRACRRN